MPFKTDAYTVQTNREEMPPALLKQYLKSLLEKDTKAIRLTLK
jgi:hypothetical protein